MKGNEELLYQYMEGHSKRFIIPVYQRNYDWTKDQCKQLYDDLVRISKENTKRHFFGSIVSSMNEGGGQQEYLIIVNLKVPTQKLVLFLLNKQKSIWFLLKCVTIY